MAIVSRVIQNSIVFKNLKLGGINLPHTLIDLPQLVYQYSHEFQVQNQLANDRW